MVELFLYSNGDAEAVEYLLEEAEATYTTITDPEKFGNIYSTPCLELSSNDKGPVARSYGFNVSNIMSMVKTQRELG